MAEDTAKKVKYVPMVVEKSQVPKGAIRLTRDDVLNIQQTRLDKCKSTSDKFAFRFAPHILAGSSVVTAAAINSYNRRKFQLFSLGLMSSYAPVVVIPTVLCLAANEIMSKEVLLQPSCKECLQVRSGVLQAAASTLYSGIFAPVISLALSKKYLTFMNPKNRFEPNLIYAFKTKASSLGWFAVLMAVNFALGACVRYKQQKQIEHIMELEPFDVSRDLLEAIRD